MLREGRGGQVGREGRERERDDMGRDGRRGGRGERELRWGGRWEGAGWERYEIGRVAEGRW